MLVTREPDGQARYACLGYAAFSEKLNDPKFAKWFTRMTDDIEQCAQGSEMDEWRMRELQHALIDLIDFFDRTRTRVPESRRRKLP
jgi:ketosteroid isomerase-like protein